MSADLTSEQIEKVLKGITIPPQPQILVDIQMEQAMPDPDLGEIANLISKDVGLSGSILRTVNSPVFGLKSKISSIKHAVNLLGSNSVVNIVNAVTIKSELSGAEQMGDDVFKAMNQFWDTAHDIADASAYLAKQVGFRSPDEAYTLGLFHNAGIPLMLSRFDNYLDVLKDSYSGNHVRIIDAENEHLNTNHAVLGFYVGKSWNLPADVCEAIAQHHNAVRVLASDSHISSEIKNMIAILKMAEHLARFYHHVAGQDTDHEWDSIKDRVLEYLGLTEYDLDDITTACQDMGIGQESLL